MHIPARATFAATLLMLAIAASAASAQHISDGGIPDVLPNDGIIVADSISDEGVPGTVIGNISDGCGCNACLQASPGCSCDGHCDGCGTRLGGWNIEGWISQGFTLNPQSPRSNTNTPITFNDRANEYQMNQLYLSLQRNVAQGRQWDLGGRVDLLFGTDYFFTMASGLETHTDGTQRWNRDSGPRSTGAGAAPLYGIAMPQAYAEVHAPIGNGVDVKLGHFYTIMGYESVMAPENFFYSHAYTMQYGEPFTHTGMLATSKLGRNVELYAGFTRGWDNWEDIDGNLAVLGGLKIGNRFRSLTFTVHTGTEPTTPGNANRTVASGVFQTRYRGTQFVLQSDFGVSQDGALALGPNTYGPAKWYGINTYVFQDLSDTVAVGLRAEWFRDQDNSRVIGIPISPTVRGQDYFEFTVGANIRPWSFVTIRPEIRWDYSNVNAIAPLNIAGPYDDFSRDNQLTLALDIVCEL